MPVPKQERGLDREMDFETCSEVRCAGPQRDSVQRNQVFTSRPEQSSAGPRGRGPRGRKSCVGKICALAPLWATWLPRHRQWAWQKHTSDRKGGCGEARLAATQGRCPSSSPPEPRDRGRPGPAGPSGHLERAVRIPEQREGGSGGSPLYVASPCPHFPLSAPECPQGSS